jgi:hypothetical protein
MSLQNDDLGHNFSKNGHFHGGMQHQSFKKGGVGKKNNKLASIEKLNTFLLFY